MRRMTGRPRRGRPPEPSPTVISQGPNTLVRKKWLQDCIAPIWSRACGGCHPNRNTLTAIRDSGFETSDVGKISFGMTHVLGRAQRRYCNNDLPHR